MPTPPSRRIRPSSSLATRSVYARSPRNMLVNDGATGINPSEVPPIWWYGVDSSGGASPIGPNGPWAHGQAETRPVVIRATSLITGPLTAAPFKVMELGYPARPLGRPRWVTDPMLLRPDSRFATDLYSSVVKLPRGEFWTEWIRNAIWWGCGCLLFEEDEAGQPLAGTLKNLDPRMVHTERDSSGALHWALAAENGDPTAVFDRDGYLQLGSVRYRIVCLRNPHSPIDAEGHSRGVFALAPGAFELAGQVESYAHGQFRSGIPNGVLQVSQPGLTQEQANELKAAWMRAHGNDRRSIAVLNATTSFVPMNLSPVDAQLNEVARLSLGSVAFAFGLDPLTLGVSLGNSATYNNLRDAWSNHRDFGLAPWVTAVEDVLSSLLPGTAAVKVDMDHFANPTLRERMEGYQVAIESGVMTVDEVRELEGLGPLDQAPASAPAEPTPLREVSGPAPAEAAS